VKDQKSPAQTCRCKMKAVSAVESEDPLLAVGDGRRVRLALAVFDVKLLFLMVSVAESPKATPPPYSAVLFRKRQLLMVAFPPTLIAPAPRKWCQNDLLD
jgi:hypothetical protein